MCPSPIDKAFVEKIPRTVYQITEEGETALVSYREALSGCFIPTEEAS